MQLLHLDENAHKIVHPSPINIQSLIPNILYLLKITNKVNYLVGGNFVLSHIKPQTYLD